LKLSSTIIFILLFTQAAISQLAEPDAVGESYYLFPIKPGVKNTLAGTMGELRSSHFHTGLDIRTEGRTGLAVHSSADGHIMRAVMSTSGYGNALYVKHPNGTITVYAHLEKFKGDIAEYVLKQQYDQKSFEINLMIPKNKFPVKRGEVIALSGNSGSSGGPHLHYDIRDANNNPINPLNYGFNEILDRTPPVAKKISVKTLDKYSRVNDQFGRQELDLVRVGNNYKINKPIKVYGKIGLELYGYDKLDYSRYRCGIRDIEVYVNGQLTFSQTIDKLSFARQRNILVHMNYSELLNSGHRYHKLYVDDGNRLGFYESKNKGILSVANDTTLSVRVKMIDSYNNESFVDFSLTGATPDYKINGTPTLVKTPELIDNTLVLSKPIDDLNSLNIFLPEQKSIPASYILNNEQAIFLWDMRNGLPYNAKLGDDSEVFNYNVMIPPGKSYSYYSEHIDVYFSAKALFDTLYMKSNYEFDSIHKREIFSIGDQHFPLNKYLKVTLKPEKNYSDSLNYQVYTTTDNGRLYHKGGEWNGDKISFYTRNFGQFTIVADSVPPKIYPVKTNQNQLMFKISDDLSGIDSYECRVNGEWVLMHYDYKRRLIWSEKINKAPFTGEVVLNVVDNSGNETNYISNL